MLSLYRVADAVFQFEQGQAPPDAIPVESDATTRPDTAGAPASAVKSVKPANKQATVRNK